MDSRPTKGKDKGIEYLIKWEGYDELSWIPWQSMVGSMELVKKWENERPRKRKLPPNLWNKLEKLAMEDAEERTP